MAWNSYSPQQLTGVLSRRIAPWSGNYTATVLGNAANNVEARAAEREEDLENRALTQNTNYQTAVLGQQKEGLALEKAAQDMLNNYLNTQLSNTNKLNAIATQSSSDTDTAGKIATGISAAKMGWDIGTSKGAEKIADWIFPETITAAPPTPPTENEVRGIVTSEDLQNYTAGDAAAAAGMTITEYNDLMKWLMQEGVTEGGIDASSIASTGWDALSSFLS